MQRLPPPVDGGVIDSVPKLAPRSNELLAFNVFVEKVIFLNADHEAVFPADPNAIVDVIAEFTPPVREIRADALPLHDTELVTVVVTLAGKFMVIGPEIFRFEKVFAPEIVTSTPFALPFIVSEPYPEPPQLAFPMKLWVLPVPDGAGTTNVSDPDVNVIPVETVQSHAVVAIGTSVKVPDPSFKALVTVPVTLKLFDANVTLLLVTPPLVKSNVPPVNAPIVSWPILT